MYRERVSAIDGSVVWTARTGAEHLVLPDGCTDLMWIDGALLVAGPDTTAHLTTLGAGRTVTGLRFAPGTGPALFGVPGHELRDARVPLDDVWPATVVARLADAVATAPDPGRALERIAVERLRVAAPEPVTGIIAARLAAGHPVGDVAAAVGLSARQVHRRSHDAFGYGPKTLARVLRLARALAVARAGTPFGLTAARCGYAGQTHLARDVRALTGTTLGALTRVR